jgi:hypothetical protein
VFPARYELNSYIVFRKRLVSKRLTDQSKCRAQHIHADCKETGRHNTRAFNKMSMHVTIISIEITVSRNETAEEQKHFSLLQT